MNGYNFTDRVRKALIHARHESERFHHPYVGPEHILLGLLREGEGVATAVIRACKVDPDALRARLEAAMPHGDPNEPIRPDVPYTSQAKRVLELAMAEARTLNYPYVGTEHLLLGVLRAEGVPLAGIVAGAGLTLDATRAAALALRGTDDASGESVALPSNLGAPFGGASSVPPTERTARIALVLALVALLVGVVALARALRALP